MDYKKIIPALCLFFFVVTSVSLANERWVTIADNEHFSILLDTESFYVDRIKRTDKNNSKIVSCWQKIIFKSDEARNFVQEHAEKNKKAANIDFSKSDYNLLRCNYDINNGEYAEEVELYFDNTGKQIYSEELSTEWYYVEPESDEEKIILKIKEKLKL